MSIITISKIYDEVKQIKQLINIQSVELLDLNQTAEYLKLKPSYIYSLIHQKKIPYYKPIGKRVYFDKSELSKWILESKIKTTKEIEEEYNKQKESEKK